MWSRQSTSTKLRITKFSSEGLGGNSAKFCTSENFPLYGTLLIQCMLVVIICGISQILELLWRLAHLPQLSREMVELALDSHSSILIDSYHTKDAEKKTYIAKCVEDIKKVSFCVVIHRCIRGS